MSDVEQSSLIEAARLAHVQAVPERQADVAAAIKTRDAAVAAAHKAGSSYAVIAEALDCSESYVQVMVQRANGTTSPSRNNRTNGKRGRPKKVVNQA